MTIQIHKIGYSKFEVIRHPAGCACNVRIEIYVGKLRIRVLDQ